MLHWIILEQASSDYFKYKIDKTNPRLRGTQQIVFRPPPVSHRNGGHGGHPWGQARRATGLRLRSGEPASRPVRWLFGIPIYMQSSTYLKQLGSRKPVLWCKLTATRARENRPKNACKAYWGKGGIETAGGSCVKTSFKGRPPRSNDNFPRTH